MALEWIDLAIKTSEVELASAISGLTALDRARLTASLQRQLRLPQEDLEVSVLRLLVERARGISLPSSVWSRPVTATTSVRSEAERHLNRLNLAVTPARLTQMQKLYASFAVSERKSPVTVADLQAQDFRCGHCGLAFCNEQIEKFGITSPHGTRKKSKNDLLKPHWAIAAKGYREPTMDHIWSIKVYGDNQKTNLRVQCRGCNEGKANYLAMENLPSWTGLCGRQQLEANMMTLEVFYAQLRRQPACERSGAVATTTELTVVLRDPLLPAVLDNLITVASPGL